MKILYVEDDASDIELTRRLLAQSAPHMSLDVATTLREAHKHITTVGAAYDLALVDLHLPDGTGFDLLKEIREQDKSMAVVILTGAGDEGTAINALKAGADDYISKKKDYLLRLPTIVEEALERFRAEKVRRSHPLKVLYTEHNAADIDLTKRHFARYATHVQLNVAHTGNEMLQCLGSRSTEYDVLLLDYRLPGMSALELLKTLYQELHLDIPTVLVTGHGDEEIAVHALRLGVSAYVVKNPGYLFELPAILENAYYGVEIERKQEKLAESEKLFRLFAENARDVIYRVRVKPLPVFEYISPAVTDVTGYTPDEYYADSELITKIIHPEDRPLLAEASVDAHIERALVLRWIHKKGHIIWTEQRNRPIYDDQGELIALEGIGRDITERQQTLESLRASEIAEREQRLLAEALRDTAASLISSVKLDTVMHAMLENVSRVVPHDAANIMLIEDNIARPVYWHGYPADYTPLIQKIFFLIDETPNLHEMLVTQLPFLIAHTDDYASWVPHPVINWIQSHVAAPILSHGKVIGFLSLDSKEPNFFTQMHVERLEVFADQASLAIEHAQLYEQIQHHAEQLEQRVSERTAELQRSEARYRAIIENQTDLVCRYLPGGILTFANHTFFQHFSQTPEELLGKSLFDLIPTEERTKLEEHIASLNQKQYVATIELQGATKNGKVRWIQWRNRMLFDEMGNFIEYQGVGRDITERKIAEEQLQQMLGHAMKLNDLRSRYMAMAAHDLRNPLTAIQGAVSILEMFNDQLTDEQKQQKLDQIQNAINLITTMLDDILTIGRIESGKLEFNPSLVDIYQFCENLVAEVELFTRASHKIEFSSEGNCTVAYIDVKLVRHILINLLSNAIKYSPNAVSVWFAMDCNADQIIFRIRDQGIGIPDAEQHRLFESFYRAGNVKTITGSGLGLAIVKQSVDLHKGTIAFESQENIGTIFTVAIPRGSYNRVVPK